jgi:hypothetical protein
MSYLWSIQCAETFHLAFPERPQEKVDMLANRMANKDGKICEYGHTDKKKIKFFSYIRKFRVEQLQSHI